ncbi:MULTISPECIES: AI-2E family transporter [unclassified Arthrobacter]|uniref:AI-2E family transporter n=1 Tax=unclassified Arthrobacter TaxID=235627 RepID=UPI002DFF7FD1|nr:MULTISPECIES: AI-2E family transporter [unclassified Arthrobacter]MEC5190855.1 AI-2 transport protein TqsA [Arthrobacter sp. MP_M4]MEC5202127.1 AI-2 transport protein TqsA [Arthrobacter sp. MP_M7]
MGQEPAGPGPAPVLPRSAIILVALAGASVAAFGIAAMRGIFTPVFFAFVLTLCVHPLRRWMQGRGVPRGIATGTTVAAVFALLTGFAAILVASLAQFSALLPQFGPQMAQLGASIAGLLETAGFGRDQTQAVVDGLTPVRIVGFLGGLLGNVVSLVGSLVIILTMLILMAVDGSRIPALLTHLQFHRPVLVAAFNDFAGGVRRYMIATTVLGVAQGLFNWLVLVTLQVPGALLWGLLSFICSFIPNIGYFIAIVPPLFFGFLTGGWPTVLAVIVIYGGINTIIQSIIQPKYVGNAVALSETITFLSVLFWAVILGPAGAILAVPLTLLVRTILLDSDPSVSWWRPMTGDKKDLEVILKHEDDAIRARRARRGPGLPDPGSTPKA